MEEVLSDFIIVLHTQAKLPIAGELINMLIYLVQMLFQTSNAISMFKV